MHLIFDFDGTLIDSFDTVIEKFNILASEFNFKKISESELIDLKNLKSKDLIKYLGIPIYKIPSVLKRARVEMSQEIVKLPAFPNIPKVLKKMHDLNFSLGILTSNSKENVINWLESNNMSGFFNFIHAESNSAGIKKQ